MKLVIFRFDGKIIHSQWTSYISLHPTTSYPSKISNASVFNKSCNIVNNEQETKCEEVKVRFWWKHYEIPLQWYKHPM